MRTDDNNQKQIIYTVTANCQDCYRCVRVCPVKAIRVINGQAYIDDRQCIKCGTCVRECPQHAKTIRSGLDTARALMEGDAPVAASVAPSFAAVFPGWQSSRLPAALRRLGFAYVSETAEGAEVVADSSRHTQKGSICTACPAVVNYIEKYRTDKLEMLMPLASPMIAHAKMLKKRLGASCRVVFIGPCAAKKSEALRPENAGLIDSVLTFTELIRWLEDEDINLASCEQSSFQSMGDLRNARLFPLEGGLLKTADIQTDLGQRDVLPISGHENILRLLDMPGSEWGFSVVEPLFCPGGCIAGPGMPSGGNLFTLRRNLIEYAEQSGAGGEIDRRISLDTTFENDSVEDILPVIDEVKIQKILESTGKSDALFQLNCGACGYKTCRDNAIAVMRGMAEPGMCIPYMRRLAEQRTDKIIETSPNGIVILDEELKIINMNPAFQRMFMCNNSILGRRISYLVDAGGFEKLAAGAVERYESIQKRYGIKYHELLYRLPDEKQYVGIYMDITKIRFDEKQIDLIKMQSVEHARDLLDHQIRFSQEMASFLGRSTAQTEDLVKKLMSIYEDA